VLNINPTIKLVLGLILVGGIGALQAIAKVEPTWAWVATIVQVLTAVELFLTPAPSGPKPPAGPIVGALGLLALAVVLCGCPQAAATIPADVVLVECVADDAVAGKPVAQIVTDCGTDLDTVVAILLASKKPSVANSLAAGEARVVHATR